MKSRKIIALALLVLGFGFNSCEDNLDITQPGEINEAVIFGSMTTFQNALNAVYGAFPYTNQMNFTAVWTDEIRLGLTNGGQGIGDGSWGYVLTDQSGAVAGIWNTHHRVINLANRVIVGSSSVPTQNDADVARVADMVAQARFMRALALIQVMPYFTTDPSDDNALSIIAFEDVPSVVAKRPRSTNGEIYQIITQDLDFAQANLATRTGADALRFANANACIAIRARMAIYRKQYTQAQAFAQQLIDAVPLSPRNQYGAMWTDVNLNERLFFIARQVGDPTFAGLWSNVGPGVNNNNWYEMGRGLFEKYANNDIRRYVFTGLGGQQGQTPNDPDYVLLGVPIISTLSPDPDNDPDYRQNDQICIYKYPGKNNVQYLADFKLLRVAEMHLIKAEALIGQNQLADAALALKVLKDARHSAPTALPSYASQQAAYADLLLERRKELCFEGHRYIDMKRLGALANQSFDRFFRDCALNLSCTPPAIGDHRFTLPIPNSERNANPNVTQNPGY
jgi:starch-binding outer membrane protein, SusD/RagB family